MCGFCGIAWPRDVVPSWDPRETTLAMAETIIHRGPDDLGLHVDPSSGIALGFRRLSILDLTADGHQPMFSESGRYVLVFNGEVYNHAPLREELASRGHRFRGHSDTEVILAAAEEWGLEASLPRFAGMFAIALWDRELRRLTLARDRVGKKPLYYGWQGGFLLFGSELKALRRHPAFRAEIDRDALEGFLQFCYVPGPRSIFQGIRKLPAAHLLVIDPARPGELGEPVPYWDPRAVAVEGQSRAFAGTEAEAVERLDALLREAVATRMVADVPVGAFLSGGIDSSLVVALMQAQSSQPARTFSIGFEEGGFNEAPFAQAVARHLGTRHTELYVSPREAMDVVPLLPRMFDEPFSDSSQIPTYLVSRLARRDVTVVLSGDGGDEVFGGYRRHFTADGLMRRIRGIPMPVRRLAAASILGTSPRTLDRTFRWVEKGLPRTYCRAEWGENLHKFAGMLTATDPQDLYLRAVTHWKPGTGTVLGAAGRPARILEGGWDPAFRDAAHQMMYLDLVSYLVDDILVKVDRATMAVSLEGRAPYLDHRVIEFAWTLPPALKFREGQGKHILRKVLDKYVPRDLIDRPKQGFVIPIQHWLSGPFRDWGEALLDPARLRREGYFDPAPIRARWEEHLAGKRNWQYHLWDVLSFQAWLDAESRPENPEHRNPDLSEMSLAPSLNAE